MKSKNTVYLGIFCGFATLITALIYLKTPESNLTPIIIFLLIILLVINMQLRNKVLNQNKK